MLLFSHKGTFSFVPAKKCYTFALLIFFKKPEAAGTVLSVTREAVIRYPLIPEKMFNIVLFGPPGAGKGTQASKLIEKYGFNHISTGEAIRDEISKGTELGLSVRDYIEAGRLAPDRLVVGIIEDYVERQGVTKGNIFDGFPRTTPQAEAFDVLLEKHGKSIDVMLSLDVEDDELVKRLLLRGKESGRADDASEEVIRNRISVYKAQTAVVASYYKPQGKYRAVDGLGSVDEVFDRLCKEIDAIMR